MANSTVKQCQVDQKERNLFLSFLAEYHNSRSPNDIVCMLAGKRRRFWRLHNAVLKALALHNHEKCWHIATYLRNLMAEDEYPDELVIHSVEEVNIYLDVILALCAFETRRDAHSNIIFCNQHIQIQCNLYPVLFSILAGCYIKLKMDDQAEEVVISGLKCIMQNYKVMVELREQAKKEKTFFLARLFGDNSPSFNFYVLYAYAQLLRLPLDDEVQQFGLQFPTESLVPVIESLSFKPSCCFGTHLYGIMLCEKYMSNMLPVYIVEFEDVESNDKCRGEHVLPHCRIEQVVVNRGQMNVRISVKCFTHVHYFLVSNVQQQFATKAIQSAPSACLTSHRNKNARQGRVIRGSNRTRRLFKTLISTLLVQFRKHVRLESKIGKLYLQCFDAAMPGCRLAQEMEDTAKQVFAMQYWQTLPMRYNRRRVKQYVLRITNSLTSWREYIEHVFAYMHVQGVITTAARVPQAAKETQTNYNKLCCSGKQTQTPTQKDKHSSGEEISRQIDKLKTKMEELEGRLLELGEEKRIDTEAQNKTIKTLKKELNQARRTIVEKNKEISQQQNQIEQLQTNVSQLNKPYAHAVKSPKDEQKAVCDKNAKEMAKLQALHAHCVGKNKSLQKQLDDLADEFDQMKARRDALEDAKEEVALAYQDKCDQLDDLDSRIQCLKMENSKLQLEQAKFVQLKRIILQGAQDFLDLLVGNITQYKMRSERIYQELTYYFYTCKLNYNIKQMCDSNQAFLSNIGGRLENHRNVLNDLKEVFAGDSIENFETQVTALNWKSVIISSEEFCTVLLNQYVQTLNSTMSLHSALSNALGENARLINETMSPTAAAMMEPEKYSRPHYHQNQPNPPERAPGMGKMPMPLQALPLPHTSNLGPIGSNRPNTTVLDHPSKSKSGTPSPVEINDPSTKNILSQIAHAVNFPSSLAHASGSRQQGMQGLDHSQGVIRRMCASPNQGAGHQGPRVDYAHACNMDRTMKENYNMAAPPPTPVNFAQALEHDLNALGAKNREIFMALKKRLPNAMMKDLLGPLNVLRSMNINLYKIPMETIVDHVESCIRQQEQLRMRTYESPEPMLSDMAPDEYCSICFEKLSLMPTNKLKCSHIFHDKCIRTWIRKNNVCPICRNFTILE